MNLFARNVRTTETFYVLDFDRCLGSTDALQSLLEKVLEAWPSVDQGMIEQARQEVKKTGFDMASFTRQKLNERHVNGDEIWHQIEKAFLQAAVGKDMLEPHAKSLLDKLDARHARYGILTFGGQRWQTLKLNAAGLLHLPHMIVSNKAKGSIIASWQQSNGDFIVPVPIAGDQSVRASGIVFIDDKPLSFDGIPKEVVGICVAPMANKEQIDALPLNVTVVADMAQAAKVLFGTN